MKTDNATLVMQLVDRGNRATRLLDEIDILSHHKPDKKQRPRDRRGALLLEAEEVGRVELMNRKQVMLNRILFDASCNPQGTEAPAASEPMSGRVSGQVGGTSALTTKYGVDGRILSMIVEQNGVGAALRSQGPDTFTLTMHDADGNTDTVVILKAGEITPESIKRAK